MLNKVLKLIEIKKQNGAAFTTGKESILTYLKENEDKYSFHRYPWTLWLVSAFILLLSVYIKHVLFTIGNSKFSLIFSLLIMYSLSIYILYSSKIETLLIDNKKNTIKLTHVNLFLSKVEKLCYTDDLVDIEIILKGVTRKNYDSSRYFIRLKFKEDEITFGECLDIDEASDKFRKCFAILKGIIIPNIIDDSFVYDETTQE